MNSVYGTYHQRLKDRAKKDKKAAEEYQFALDEKHEKERQFKDRLASLNEYERVKALSPRHRKKAQLQQFRSLNRKDAQINKKLNESRSKNETEMKIRSD